MISFAVPVTWTSEQIDAVAVFLERLFGDICAHVPLDALFCTSCSREQLHLPFDDDAAFIDEYRQDDLADLPEFDWSPPQLAAVVSVMGAINRHIHALYDDVVAQDSDAIAEGGNEAQLEFPLRRREPEPAQAVIAWGDIPF